MLASVVAWLEDAFGAGELHLWLVKAALGLGLLLVGVWLARWMARGVDRLLRRFAIDDILRSFLRNIAFAIALMVVFVAALDFIGVPTTSLLAVMGAAGLAVGLALKDSLSNIASGVMLIVQRPFHIGDLVQVAGMEGTVESVHLFQTRLLTADNRQIYLPNGQITSAPITNFTGLGTRRVDLNVPMSFTDDLGTLRTALVALARANPRVQATPAPAVMVGMIGEGTVTVQMQAWVSARDYLQVRAELLESALEEFHRRGMRSPLPAREVHVHHHDAPALPMPDEVLKSAL